MISFAANSLSCSLASFWKSTKGPVASIILAFKYFELFVFFNFSLSSLSLPMISLAPSGSLKCRPAFKVSISSISSLSCSVKSLSLWLNCISVRRHPPPGDSKFSRPISRASSSCLFLLLPLISRSFSLSIHPSNSGFEGGRSFAQRGLTISSSYWLNDFTFSRASFSGSWVFDPEPHRLS